MNQEEATAKIAELMDGAHICTLTTIDDEGQMVSRPMGLQNETFNGELWFFTPNNTPKVAHINQRPQVNVAFEHNNSYVSVSGEAETVNDRAKAEELWSEPMKAWFPDGLDSPDLQLLKVTATSAQYWDTANSKLVTLFAYAKSRLTGERPDVGESKKVDL